MVDIARTVKCPVCEAENEREKVVENKIGRRYYCDECYEKTLKEKEKKKKEKKKKREGWDKLFNYIVELYGHKPTGMMFKQLKKYRDDYGYTNYGMYLTLVYFYEILGKRVQENSGLGIIPYVYDDAKKYYGMVDDIQQHNEQMRKTKGTKKVKVKRTKHNNNQRLIDFSKIKGDDTIDD